MAINDLSNLATVKTNLQITDSSMDNTIEQLITSVSQSFIKYWGNWTPLATHFNPEIRNRGYPVSEDYIRVNNPPIITLNSVTLGYGGTSPKVISTGMTADPITGVIQYQNGCGSNAYDNCNASGFQSIAIDYIGGYVEVPSDIVLALSGVVGKLLFTMRQGRMGIASKRVGDVSIDYRAMPVFDPNNPLFGEYLGILKFYKRRVY